MNLLLPELYKKRLRREKIARLAIFFIGWIAAVLVIGIIAMLPSYFSLVFLQDDVQRRLKSQEESFARHDVTSLENKINTINTLLASYQKNELLRHFVAPLILKISNAAEPSIALSSLELEKKSGGVFILTLRGKANVRNDLLSYIDQFKMMPEFSSVRSPVSNILQSKDVSFTLEITPRTDFYGYRTQ